jgi:hypothetical protein
MRTNIESDSLYRWPKLFLNDSLKFVFSIDVI